MTIRQWHFEDILALAELEKQAESINAELGTLYEEYFSLDEQME